MQTMIITQPRRALHAPRSLGLFLGACAAVWLLAAGCATRPSKGDLDVSLISQAWKTIQRQYVAPSTLNSTTMTYAALSGMVDALGDTGHSAFLTPDMVKNLAQMELGRVLGIGIQIQEKGGYIVVVTPMDGSPAQRAGIRAGDRIVQIAGQDTKDWTTSMAVAKITGPPGTKVKLTLSDPRTSQTREVIVPRAVIRLHEVTWQRVPGTSVVHLRLASFGAGVSKDLRRALESIQAESVSGVVLDMRNNPGGLLDEAVAVASQFLTNGNVLISKDSEGNLTPIRAKKGGAAPIIPMAVLINNGSASAAEIVAGALQFHHRATLIGETTFGTGTVLRQFDLSDGSALLLAIGEWLTPDGRSFWHKGIVPDEKITLPADVDPLLPASEQGMSPDQLKTSGDLQLLRALQVLQKAQANRNPL